jgi:hypothetical protein
MHEGTDRNEITALVGAVMRETEARIARPEKNIYFAA